MLHGLWRPQVIATACHTVGHVSFLVGDAGPTARAAIFTGAPDAYKVAPTRNTQRTRNTQTQHADATRRRNTQTQHADATRNADATRRRNTQTQHATHR